MLDPISHHMLRSLHDNPSRGPLLLMYHGTPQIRPESIYSLSATQFSRHLDFLRDHEWHTACVRDLMNAAQLPTKTVIITFDDGYADNYEGAFLPLVKREMKATWFIVSGVIGGHAHWMGPQNLNTAMLDVKQVCEIATSGMEIGSHTHTHPDLTRLSDTDIREELVESKEKLEDYLGRAVTSFAYPFGRFDERCAASVAEAGYTHACTVRAGWYGSELDQFLLRRVTIFRDETIRSFARKLVFADNDVSWAKLGRYALGRVAARIGGR